VFLFLLLVFPSVILFFLPGVHFGADCHLSSFRLRGVLVIFQILTLSLWLG
jgi:hypothetical protein